MVPFVERLVDAGRRHGIVTRARRAAFGLARSPFRPCSARRQPAVVVPVGRRCPFGAGVPAPTRTSAAGLAAATLVVAPVLLVLARRIAHGSSDQGAPSSVVRQPPKSSGLTCSMKSRNSSRSEERRVG